MHRQARQAGAALVIVIWALAIIGAVVAAYFTRGLLEAKYTHDQRAEAEARALAQAGIAYFVRLFLTDDDEIDTPNEGWFLADEDAFSFLDAEGTIAVRVHDYGSRVNLNLANEPELLVLFKDNQPAAQAILDWRDADRQKRPLGAEDDFYGGLDPPVAPANGFFQCPEEVFLVKGMEGFRRTIEAETAIHGPANPNLIAPEVWAGILESAGIIGWQAELMTEQFAAARREAVKTGRVPFKKLEDLLQIPSVTHGTVGLLTPYLTFQGQINPNLASERQLRVGLSMLGLSTDWERLIREARQESVFRDFSRFRDLLDRDELEHPVSDERLAQVFTLQTTLVWVDVVGYTKNRDLHRIAALIERYRPEGRTDRWHGRILYWREWPGQEFPLRPEGQGGQ